jgi:hypothetical protein
MEVRYSLIQIDLSKVTTPNRIGGYLLTTQSSSPTNREMQTEANSLPKISSDI